MQKIKRKGLWIVAVCVIGIAAVFLTLCYRDIYVKRENLLLAYEKEIVSGIVCYGDSLTAGAGGDGVTYPLIIRERLEQGRIYIPVINMGIGGETSITIAGRAGGVPFQVKKFTIPAGTEPVEVSFRQEEGRRLNLLVNGDTGINPCMICGVEGRLYGEKKDKETVCYFSRSESGETVEVPEGTEVRTWAADNYKDYIYVIFIGQNKGWTDIDDLISQQKAILDMQEEYAGRYIIVGLTTGTREERKELEDAMFAEYGDKYINLREYLSTEGLDAAGIKATDEDLEQMERGEVPSSLLSDNVHFNAEGYRLIGNLIYERMDELGYFDELHNAVAEYGH